MCPRIVAAIHQVQGGMKQEWVSDEDFLYKITQKKIAASRRKQKNTDQLTNIRVHAGSTVLDHYNGLRTTERALN